MKEIFENIELGPAIEYTKKHCTVVEGGINEILKFYESADKKNKLSLLFCLDRYLDPYYEHKLAHEKMIYKWLKSEKTKTSDKEISSEISELLQLRKKWWQF